MSLEELEQDPFDPKEYIERIAWRKTGALSKDNVDKFDPMALHSEFKKKIAELKELNTKVQRRADRLESSVKEEERRNWQGVVDIERGHQDTTHKFEALAEKINFVAAKVVHLGDQLEGAATPRGRAVEAQKLMLHFSDFVDGPSKSHLWNDPAKLEEAADITHKLYVISLELPPGDQFDMAKKRVSDKYFEIERRLIEEFVLAQHRGRVSRMRAMAQALSPFKGYTQCVDEFIEESQKQLLHKLHNTPNSVVSLKEGDIFEEVLPLCVKAHSLIDDVFANPEAVMGKFVLNIFNARLKEHIVLQLEESQGDLETHLRTLHRLYTRTADLATDLSNARLGNDSSFLQKLVHNIFGRYVANYSSLESKFLKEKCGAILNKFYESKNHVKRNIQSGGLQDFRRDLQAKLALGGSSDGHNGESLISQEVAINLLQEYRSALDRCNRLSGSEEVAGNAFMIYELMVQQLFRAHIEYGLEIGLLGIPASEPKSAPELTFLDTASQCNTVVHLSDKLLTDSLLPLLSSSAYLAEVTQKSRQLQQGMETKLEQGLERTLTAVAAYTKHILAAEQKKTDFKIESDEGFDFNKTKACAKVVRYLEGVVGEVRRCLDGRNVEAVLAQLGIRFHRVIQEHMLQFQYSSIGAMLAICDVAEYRKVALTLDVALVAALFDTLHALLNLLIVPPENLPQVTAGEQLAVLDRATIHAFVQLRADYKSERLGVFFR